MRGIGYPYVVIDVKDLSENPDKFRASQRARAIARSLGASGNRS